MPPLLRLPLLTTSPLHSLRALSTLSLVPAAPLLLTSSLLASRATPALTLLPLSLSALYSALLLAHEKTCGCRAAGITGTPVHMLCDMLCGLPLLVCLVLGWASKGGWGWEGAAVMVGTYGTVFVLFNLGVHAFFVGREVREALRPGARYPGACPRCQHMVFPRISVKFAGEGRDGYEGLLDGERRPAAAVNAEDAV